MVTYDTSCVEQTVLDECIGETGIVALPMVGVAITHGSEYPREVDSGATAGKQQLYVYG